MESAKDAFVSCIWIAKINDCNYSRVLNIIAYLSLAICISIFLPYVYMIIKQIKYGFKTKINDVLNIDFQEITGVTGLLMFTFRIIYISLLIINANKIVVMLFENFTVSVCAIYENLVIAIITKILERKDDIYVLPFKLNLIWIILTFLLTTVTSIIAGYYFQTQNIKIAYTVLGIHFLINGIQMSTYGVISFYYRINLLILLDQNKRLKNRIETINNISIAGGIAYGMLWILQAVWVWIDYTSYENNFGWTIFVSLFWYFGGMTLVFLTLLILYI